MAEATRVMLSPVDLVNSTMGLFTEGGVASYTVRFAVELETIPLASVTSILNMCVPTLTSSGRTSRFRLETPSLSGEGSVRISESPRYHFTDTTCQLSEYVPVMEIDSPNARVMFSDPSILARGGDRSDTLISWNFVAGRPSTPMTLRYIVRSPGSSHVVSTDIPAKSLNPSPFTSHR